MIQIYAVTIVLLAIYAAAGNNRHIQQKVKNTVLRVHGGVGDTTGKYPYVVALKETYPALSKICTGSLIKDKWVLSAAHCLSPTIKFIQFGNMSKPLAQTNSKSIVLKMIRHPGYIKPYNHDDFMQNDVGLIMVERVTGMSKYARISAVDYRTLLGQPVEYAGFGMTFLPKRDTKNRFQELLLDIYRPLQIGEAVVAPCEEFPRKDLICARAKCSHSKNMILPGDSGGPLMLDNKIVGISFGVNIEMFIQSFTPVSPYLSWIHSVITSDGQSTTPINPTVAERSARISHKS